MSATDLLTRRANLLGAKAPLFYQNPVHIVRGEGVWLFSADGTRYLDVYNNVPCVGHCHPHVLEALNKQASTLNVHTRYLHELILDYAERLTGLHENPLAMATLTCTGSEANEIALRIAMAILPLQTKSRLWSTAAHLRVRMSGRSPFPRRIAL
jgi:4-aminobutyrate aminotransferase-like enzyme